MPMPPAHDNAPSAHADVESEEKSISQLVILNWLPPRDSNPDMLIQSQLSCR